MALGLQTEMDVLKTYFTNVPCTSPSTSMVTLWVGLHSSDPTGQTQGDAAGGAYAAYTRVATTRTTASGGWTITSGTSSVPATCSPTATISFPQCVTTSTGTFTFASVGVTSASTSSQILWSGAISPTINFGSGVTPQLTTGSSITLS